jgi:hypothetical protein
MFALVMAALIWMHIAVRRMENAGGKAPARDESAYAYVAR